MAPLSGIYGAIVRHLWRHCQASSSQPLPHRQLKTRSKIGEIADISRLLCALLRGRMLGADGAAGASGAQIRQKPEKNCYD